MRKRHVVWGVGRGRLLNGSSRSASKQPARLIGADSSSFV
jgi:hypothetical protein